MMNIFAQQENLSLDWRIRDWPTQKFPSTNKIITKEESTGFEYLNERDYDADLAVCIVPDAKKIGQEVGQLLLREGRQTYHIKDILVLTSIEKNSRKL